MTVHLIKLCVGCASIEELADWQKERLAEAARAGTPQELMHITRQTPRREGFSCGASSLYWVIGGYIRARQRIVELRDVKGEDGVPRCAIVFDSTLVPTEPQPRRPFQGWRYLTQNEAPKDLSGPARAGTVQDKALMALSPQMRAELHELRLI